MFRTIREAQPTWVVGENVFGITNWNGGLVFEQVQADLEAEGYEVQSYVLPAASVGAPHRRDRVWFIAHTNSQRLEGRANVGNIGEERKEQNEQPLQLFRTTWEEFPTQPPLRGRNDGVPGGLAGVTLPRWRREAIKAYGNAIVPQVAFQIFQAIEMYHERIHNNFLKKRLPD